MEHTGIIQRHDVKAMEHTGIIQRQDSFKAMEHIGIIQREDNVKVMEHTGIIQSKDNVKVIEHTGIKTNPKTIMLTQTDQKAAHYRHHNHTHYCCWYIEWCWSSCSIITMTLMSTEMFFIYILVPLLFSCIHLFLIPSYIIYSFIHSIPFANYTVLLVERLYNNT